MTNKEIQEIIQREKYRNPHDIPDKSQQTMSQVKARVDDHTRGTSPYGTLQALFRILAEDCESLERGVVEVDIWYLGKFYITFEPKTGEPDEI